VDEEQFHFMKTAGVSDTKNDQFHYLLIDIVGAEIPQVDLHSNL
jgi:hypothetical protein